MGWSRRSLLTRGGDITVSGLIVCRRERPHWQHPCGHLDHDVALTELLHVLGIVLHDDLH